MPVETSPLLPLARHLRRNMTEAEKVLWHDLRAGRLQGTRFRRQHPIGPYVADFACVSARLVIEVDGGQHNENAHDQKRDAYLQAQGWRVLRFWNNEVLGNREGVLLAIVAAVGSPPSP